MTSTEASDQTRKVVASIVISMDGFVSDPENGMGWLVPHAIEEQTRAHMIGMCDAATTTLLGRKQYEGYRAFWGPQEADPDALPADRRYSAWLNNIEKVVFSNTITSSDWTNTRVSNDLVGEVERSKKTSGGNILVQACVSIIQGLIEAELLDELHLSVLPAILGGGRRLFVEGCDPSTWQVLQTIVFASGATGIHYRLAD